MSLFIPSLATSGQGILYTRTQGRQIFYVSDEYRGKKSGVSKSECSPVSDSVTDAHADDDEK